MKRILVVEDNENNLYLIRFLLEKNGYEVIEAQTGEIGIELASNEKPDLILMDIQLPDINGYEVTKKIREREKGSETPIIALTSYAMVGDKEKALKAGCTGYIEKPINPVTIISQIEEYI